jgi:hypothetical protein
LLDEFTENSLSSFVKLVQKQVRGTNPHQSYLVQNANPLRAGLKLMYLLKKIVKISPKLGLKVTDLGLDI